MDQIPDTQFLLIDELGRGSFGRVLKVLDKETQEEIALKVHASAVPVTRPAGHLEDSPLVSGAGQNRARGLDTEPAGSPEHRPLPTRKTPAKSPGVQFRETDEHLYIGMELLTGGSLSDLL